MSVVAIEARPAANRGAGFLADAAIFLALVFLAVVTRYVHGPGAVVNDGDAVLHSGLHILAGEIPVIDYVASPYEMLSYWTAFEFFLSGGSITLDFFMSALFIGLGAGCLYVAGRLLGFGRLQSLYAPLIMLLLYPRLYNYFKIIGLSAILLALAFYFRSPTPRRAIALGIATGFCVFIRLDIGMYAALAAGLAILLFGLPSPRRFLATSAAFLLSAAPLVVTVFLLTLGRGAGLATEEGVSETLAVRIAEAAFPFRVDDLPRNDAAAAAPYYRIHVRYVPGVTEPERLAFEEAHRLERATVVDATRNTWEYWIGWYTPAGLEAIVENPIVEDTHHINRDTYELVEPSYLVHRLRELVRGISGASTNSLLARGLYVVLYYSLALSIALFAASFMLRDGERRKRARDYGRSLFVFTWMGFFGITLLIRGSWDSRTPDLGPVIALVVIYALWVTLRPLAAGRVRRGIGIVVFHLAALGVTTLAYSYASQEQNMRSIFGTVFTDPLSLPRVVSEANERIELLSPRYTASIPTERMNSRRNAARYIAHCTNPTDRLLVTAFFPEIGFWADRLLAGGRLFFHAPYGPGDFSEAESLALLREQSVPIIIAFDLGNTFGWEQFRRAFPETAAYIQANYRIAAVTPFVAGEALPFMIIVRNDIVADAFYTAPDGTELPCPSPQDIQ